MKRRKKSKSYYQGMMVLLFICAIYIIIYPYVIAPTQETGTDSSSSSYETAQNAATLVTGAEEKISTASKAAIAAIEEKEKASAKGYLFKSEEKLESHFEKHGVEMGFSTKEEYLEAANKLIANPNAMHKTESEDGDDIYYLEATDEIAFVSTDGYLRTYFICSGKDYYDRQ